MTNSYYKSIKKLHIQKYFKSIIKNKFDSLEGLLNNKVKIYDGKIIVSNKKNVINFTKKIFYKKKFRIYNQSIMEDKNNKIIFSRFNLILNQKKFKIIDEFVFDNKNKILKIIVYKF